MHHWHKSVHLTHSTARRLQRLEMFGTDFKISVHITSLNCMDIASHLHVHNINIFLYTQTGSHAHMHTNKHIQARNLDAHDDTYSHI